MRDGYLGYREMFRRIRLWQLNLLNVPLKKWQPMLCPKDHNLLMPKEEKGGLILVCSQPDCVYRQNHLLSTVLKFVFNPEPYYVSDLALLLAWEAQFPGSLVQAERMLVEQQIAVTALGNGSCRVCLLSTMPGRVVEKVLGDSLYCRRHAGFILNLADKD